MAGAAHIKVAMTQATCGGHLHKAQGGALLSFSVKPQATSKCPRRGSRVAAVLLMFLLWLGLWALGAFPELHHFLHQDANSPAHNCLVTQLQHHSVPPGLASTLAPVPPTDWKVVGHQPDFQFCSPIDYRLAPSRAPPAV
jgi:hypothetical protein